MTTAVARIQDRPSTVLELELVPLACMYYEYAKNIKLKIRMNFNQSVELDDSPDSKVPQKINRYV